MSATPTVHARGGSYEIVAERPLVDDPLGRNGTWWGVGLDVWHHGDSGIGSDRLPADHDLSRAWSRYLCEESRRRLRAYRRSALGERGPAGPFWAAEPEHQDYLAHYPDGYHGRLPAAGLGAAAGAGCSSRLGGGPLEAREDG